MKQPRRVLALFLALLFCIAILPVASFADGNEGSIISSGKTRIGQWKLYDNGTLFFTGSGKLSDYSKDSRPWMDYKDSITKVVFDDGITYIGNNTCRELNNLEEVVFPEALVKIGYHAFTYCTSLSEVCLPKGLKIICDDAFGGCSRLKSVDLPETLERIQRGAFAQSGIESITIPNGVTLDYSLFSNCTSLKSVKLPDSIEGTDYPNIGSYCFYKCSSLESIVLPAGTEKIYNDAFMGCTSLKSIVIPSSVTYISSSYKIGAFRGCTSLSDVYYNGTKEQWNKLKNDYNECLFNANLHTYYTYLPYCTSKPKYNVYAYTGNPVEPYIRVKTAAGTTLKKGTNYTIEYRNNVIGDAEVTLTGIGKYTGTITYKYRVLPSKVKDVKVASVTQTTATLTWTENPQAEKYYIFIGSTKKGETTDMTFTVTGLKAGHDYKAYVKAVRTFTDENGEPVEYMSIASPISVHTHGYGGNGSVTQPR